MRSLLPPYPFVPQPWTEITEEHRALADRDPSLQYLADIADSVETSAAADLLAGRIATLTCDLCVTGTPISAPPVEMVVVSTPGSLSHPSRRGCVIIEHPTSSGRDDRIERSAEEAVALFWMFRIEKFGVNPNR